MQRTYCHEKWQGNIRIWTRCAKSLRPHTTTPNPPFKEPLSVLNSEVLGFKVTQGTDKDILKYMHQETLQLILNFFPWTFPEKWLNCDIFVQGHRIKFMIIMLYSCKGHSSQLKLLPHHNCNSHSGNFYFLGYWCKVNSSESELEVLHHGTALQTCHRLREI